MKTLVLFLLIAASTVFARADILANGNFSDGTAHWKGDGIASSDPLGITIQLDPAKWTKIFQTFNTGEEALDFNVSYVPSSDCSLTSGPERLSGRFLSKVDLKQMLGVLVAAPIKLKPRSWLVLIVDPAGNECHYANISVAAGATGVLGANGTLRTLAAHEEKTLYLVFPPGDGTVTVQSISLSPRTASAPVAP